MSEGNNTKNEHDEEVKKTYAKDECVYNFCTQKAVKNHVCLDHYADTYGTDANLKIVK